MDTGYYVGFFVEYGMVTTSAVFVFNVFQTDVATSFFLQNLECAGEFRLQ